VPSKFKITIGAQEDGGRRFLLHNRFLSGLEALSVGLPRAFPCNDWVLHVHRLGWAGSRYVYRRCRSCCLDLDFDLDVNKHLVGEGIGDDYGILWRTLHCLGVGLASVELGV